MHNGENDVSIEERLNAFRAAQVEFDLRPVIDRLVEPEQQSWWTTLKKGWQDGRDEVEANGKTVRENEAEAKAEVIASAKKWLTNPVNVILCPTLAWTANKGMAKRGYGKHWYSPKRLAWQLLLNDLRTFASDPEEYVHNVKMAVERVKRFKR